jgi:hypothetical protein
MDSLDDQSTVSIFSIMSGYSSSESSDDELSSDIFTLKYPEFCSITDLKLQGEIHSLLSRASSLINRLPEDEARSIARDIDRRVKDKEAKARSVPQPPINKADRSIYWKEWAAAESGEQELDVCKTWWFRRIGGYWSEEQHSFNSILGDEDRDTRLTKVLRHFSQLEEEQDDGFWKSWADSRTISEEDPCTPPSGDDDDPFSEE